MEFKYSEFSKLGTFCCLEENGKIWFTVANRNGIYVYDKYTHEVEFCGYFDKEPISKENLYCGIKKNGNKLFFCPHSAENIAIYDMGTKKTNYLPLREIKNNSQYNPSIKFWGMVGVRDATYMMGYSYPAIIKINDTADHIEYFDQWIDEIDDKYKNGNTEGYVTDGYAIAGNHIYAPLECMPGIIDINTANDEMHVRNITCSFEGIGGIKELPDGKFALIGRGGNTDRLIIWDEKDDSTEEIILPDIESDTSVPFHAPLVADDSIYLMPILANHVYKINLKSKKVEILKAIEDSLSMSQEKRRMPWVTMAPHLDKNKIRFISGHDLQWHEYDVKTGQIEHFYVEYENNYKDYFKEIMDDEFKGSDILIEGRVPLSFFLESID